MNEEVNAYIEYLLNLVNIVRPQMPKFDTKAYTDSEYKLAIKEILKDFDRVDDFLVSLHYLKGE